MGGHAITGKHTAASSAGIELGWKGQESKVLSSALTKTFFLFKFNSCILKADFFATVLRAKLY